jgi:hypothetical protein
MHIKRKIILPQVQRNLFNVYFAQVHLTYLYQHRGYQYEQKNGQWKV